MLRQSLTLLNGNISKMTSLAAFILMELTVIGAYYVTNDNNIDMRVKDEFEDP